MFEQDKNREAPPRDNAHLMFDRIAHRYDLLNHLLSVNRDRAWRKRLAALLPPGDGLRVLDIATGTADQLLALAETGRVGYGVGIDPAEKMLAIARDKIARKGLQEMLALHATQGERLSFEDNSFDAVTISFGIRNVTDVSATLSEMHRVLDSGGRALILEFSWPDNPVLQRMYLVYFRHVLPHIGGIISGDSCAYRYLNRTVETFPHGDGFCDLMRQAGFRDVRRNSLTMGVATIYQGSK